MKILLIALSLFANLHVYSQNNDLEAFLNSLKNQEFNKAKEQIKFIKNNSYKNNVYNLYENIVNHKLDSTYKATKTTDKTLIFLDSIYKAYNYHNQYIQDNSKAYIAFNRSLEIANEIDNDLLKKTALIGILDVFASEIYIAGNQYLNYLDQFIALRSDKYDDVLIYIYKLIFSSKGNEELDIGDDYNSLVNNIDHIFKKINSNHPLQVHYFIEKGMQARFDDEINKSVDYFNTAYNFKNQHILKKGFSCTIIWQIAFSYFYNEDYLNSEKYLNKFSECSSSYKDQFYYDRFYSYIRGKQKVFDFAYLCLRETVDMEYKIGFQSNAFQSTALSVENKTAEKEKQLIISNQKKKQNRNIAFGLGGGLIGVSLIGFLLFKNTKRKQLIAEQEREIEIRKKEKILKNQELNTIDAMIEGQEKERQRLASDLHDSVGATLSAARLQFEHLCKYKGSGTLENEDELYSKTGKLLEQVYQEIRSMAHLKNSGVIATKGLLPAIQKLAINASVLNGLQIEVEDYGLLDKIEASLEISIFRVIQELVTNIIKHSKATEATISITQHNEMLNIIIEDNGIGFDVKKLVTYEGMGLNSIEKRIEHLEGLMEVDSTPTKGTHILIDIPL